MISHDERRSERLATAFECANRVSEEFQKLLCPTDAASVFLVQALKMFQENGVELDSDAITELLERHRVSIM